MRSKRPQKRFTHRFEITCEINKLRLRRKKHIKSAEVLEAQYNTSKAKANIEGCQKVGSLGVAMKILDEAATKKRETARIIEDVKIPRLIRLLAEFDTEPMPFIDRAVALKIDK